MISLITITASRNVHLNNMVKGLQLGSVCPDELIIVDMDGQAELEHAPKFPFRIIDFSDREGLPLAAARNKGAAEAKGQILVFLDADCVPSIDFIAKMNLYLAGLSGIIMGLPRYLNPGLRLPMAERYLMESSTLHPSRPIFRSNVKLCNDPGLFWSLCFAIKAIEFQILGGFDESFIGYGAEDTDLAFTARKKKHSFYLSDAVVFHQQHPVYSPPINHLESIVANSNRFFVKWKTWPMGGWLQDFANMGLIDWNKYQTSKIYILENPEEAMLSEAFREKAPYC